MPGIARQFEPQITRTSGAPSKYRFTARCSGCQKTDAYESVKPTSSETIKSYFKDRGWLLGRDRSHDLCPRCLAQPRGGPVTRSASQPQPDKSSSDQRRRDTADILARHLGKPEALAAEVFRPEAKPIRSPVPQAPQPAHPVLTLSSEIEQTLSGMAADLTGLRAAVELMAEQVSQLVALGSRQIEALASLPPALTQLAEGLSDGIRQIACAIPAVPPLLQSVADHASTTKADAGTTQTQAAGAEPVPVAEMAAPEPPQRSRGRRKTKDATIASEPADIVVKSLADAKGKERFYTSIPQLPRQLWDRAGFDPEDRLLLDWTGSVLSIARAAEGGVKPKSVGATTVVLQSWKLGNLNFDKPLVTGTGGSLRLVGNQH
jgi:hypothetical protein